MEKRLIYADNAATTRMSETVLQAMIPYMTELYGNPSSGLYSLGKKAKKGLEDARSRIASVLGADAEEVFFTSGGSEADNWAIRGVADKLSKKGRHIISSAIEHPAVLRTVEDLEKHGYRITVLPVDSTGLVSPEDLKAALRDDTILTAIMFANNEIGTIQPIRELCEIAHSRGSVFFTDAVQAVGHVDMSLHNLGVDLMAFSAHKIHGPKGIGGLYIKKGTRISSLITGGGQERKRRSGTENVPGAVGFAKALEEMYSEEGLKKRADVKRLRDLLSEKLLAIPYTRLNGHPTQRLPGNLHISCEFVEGESLVAWLDIMGICASTGSACSTASLDPSHVLLSIGLPHETAHGSLRLTLDFDNTEKDIAYIAKTVQSVLEKLRAMSPIYPRG
ncbi:MAG TPA: cysteine desulfurase NifS [Clostridiales bacterium]|nr:cysteine desulfurase NifS [Clostridiales bacterium]